ncbi:hypothetical protein B9T31_17295 [Acinetobacter sp. ANC 4558]|uniref:FUSC family protein n=1 Tax=Acinetobacter sp. ANC 4558 TaxID=1977876 RepID=UPI000A332A0C|nr:FUSC family protein [Acinetobacter sp. ANC 4558]OTG79195.1 hypothetical protein B9T31_17295 [Acinetobacter sp. ANC 4558]
MKNKVLNNKYIDINFHDNGVFLITSLINSIFCFLFFGALGAVVAAITTLFSHIISEAKDNKGNIFYIWTLLLIVLIGGIIGHTLKISILFYLYIFILSFFYYVSYNKDPYIDRTFPFLLIFSCIGTSMQNVNIDLIFAYITGITISVILLTILRHKNYDIDSFRNGLFAKKTYLSQERIFLRSMVYSFCIFLSLYIPSYFDLYRPYWAPLTFIILLRPKENDIIKITIYRVIGSLFGALMIVLIFHLLNFEHIYFYIFMMLIIIFLLPSFFKMNYLLKSFGITLFVLLLIEKTIYLHDPNYQLPYSRIYETIIGGSIALIASFILKKIRI